MSYNVKVYNNKEWKGRYAPSKSSFALTELDFGQGIKIDEKYLYKDTTSFQEKLAQPKVGVAPPTSTMYPYTYGVEIPSTDAVVTKSISPFYIEKLAGVDSSGMLLSILKMLRLSTRTDASVKTRYESRTRFASYANARTGTAWSYAPTSYFLDPSWFLQNSYALTNAADIRLGDILVGYEGSELSVGIIVDKDATATDMMKKWYVLTINRATKRAIYARWADMSLDPEGYHARRLVVDTTAIADASPLSAQKPFLSLPTSLGYELARSDPDGFKQWIPNTGELAYLGKIKMSLRMTSDATQDLSKLLEGASWELAEVRDYGYDAGKKEGNGNVYCNGATTFNLVAMTAPKQEDGIAVNLDGKTTTVLANGTSCVKLFTLTKGDDRSYHPNDKDIGINTTPSAPWKLVVRSGNLAAVNTSTGEIFSYFAIQAVNPVPGDDIQLDFAITASIGKLSTLVKNADGTTSSKAPRLAVYDKKMLWRANLYIDEGKGKDWNELHPWVTGNEWNRTRNSNPGDWNAILDDWTSTGKSPTTYGSAHVLEKLYLNDKVLPVGNGGQVVKYHPWVLFTQGGVNVNNSVAYGWGAQDSPFEFDQEVLQQKARILERRTLDSNDGDSATKYGSLPWNNSYGAPANIWDYYIFPIRHLVDTSTADRPNRSNFYYNGSDPTASLPTNDSETQHLYHLQAGSTVSVPGLSTYLAYSKDANRSPGNAQTNPLGLNWATAAMPATDAYPDCLNWYNTGQSEYTSGLDCSGFVWRSLAYEGSKYVVATRPSTSGFAAPANNWSIAPAALSEDPIDQPKTLGYAIPGDIIVLPGKHVVMVLNISPNKGESVKRENIQIIQEGKGQNSEWQVQTAQTWGPGSGLIDTMYFLYQLCRLQTFP